MDTNRKNNDCYFYYYSTCMKGDSCLFRHEENALGCEEVCSHWQQGKCFNQRCNLRHMELKKNRKAIPCYWESKPTGCCKPHCPFRHDLPRTLKNKEGSSETSVESANHTQPKRGSQGSESNFGNPPVDPLVVNFEEESDNESVPSSTPQKMLKSGIHVKTLEEIRLEKIQAESAAFYRIPEAKDEKTFKSEEDLPFKVMTLEEIRRAKQSEEAVEESQLQPDSTTNIKGTEEETESLISEPEEKNYLKRPVKLRRCFKRSAEEPLNNSRSRLKRTKLSDDVLSLRNGKQSEDDSMIETSDKQKENDDVSMKQIETNSLNEEESVDVSMLCSDTKESEDVSMIETSDKDKESEDISVIEGDDLLKSIDDLLCN